ncbi:CgeB family protein [Nitrospira sp.]|nr:CgeB family protein [Nitrospira sp.]
MHSAYDPISETRQWATAQQASWNEGEVAVVFGVGLLYHVEALRRTASPSRKIVVVVPDLGELRVACEARDWDSWVSGILWITGDPDLVSRELVGLGEPLRILSYVPAMSVHVDYYQTVETHLREQLAEKAGGRLHVAVIGPIYGGSLPIAGYVVSALKSLGHQVTWVDHSPHHSSYEAMGRLQSRRHTQILQGSFGELLGQLSMARIAENPPDVVLALAQAPLSLGALQQLRKKHFVTAMWFVENYRHLTYWQQVAGGYDYWFVIQRGACINALKAAGGRQVSYLPMAADPTVHRPVPLTVAEQTEFGSDVSFVGAGYANRRELLPELLSDRWSFKLWGNEWDGADALRQVVQRNGARIDTDTCLKVFLASTINLNVHSYTGRGFDPDGDFVNPRTFELAACGAFQLVDARALLPELFRPHEVATVAAPAELPAAIRRWLENVHDRTAMIQAARSRVLADHTYVHRVRQMLSEIGLSQPDRVGALLRGAREAEQLVKRAGDCPELTPLLRASQSKDRVELKDVAAEIRRKGPTAQLTQAELLILMMDEYRIETRDVA